LSSRYVIAIAASLGPWCTCVLFLSLLFSLMNEFLYGLAFCYQLGAGPHYRRVSYTL
jgi:hypothetical protein